MRRQKERVRRIAFRPVSQFLPRGQGFIILPIAHFINQNKSAFEQYLRAPEVLREHTKPLQDFPHIAWGQFCKWVSQITGLSRDLGLPGAEFRSRTAPPQITGFSYPGRAEGPDGRVLSGKGSESPGFPASFDSLRRAGPCVPRLCAPSCPRRLGKIVCRSHP